MLKAVASEVAIGSPRYIQGPVAITRDECGLADAVQKILHARGIEAHVVDAVPAESNTVILLNGLLKKITPERALTANLDVFHQLQTIGPRFSERGGLLVVVQDTGGAFGFQHIDDLSMWMAGLSGLVKTAAQEWINADCLSIDLARGKQKMSVLAERLVREICQQHGDVEVGFSQTGQRNTLRLVEKNTDPNTSSLLPNSVLVVTGGGRGITAVCLIALAKKVPLKLALLGRSSLQSFPDEFNTLTFESDIQQAVIAQAKARGESITPKIVASKVNALMVSIETHKTLSALRSLGSEAVYLPADVTDAPALSVALAQVREQWGQIDGVIHASGVLSDKLIIDKTDEQFTRVFNTKVMGLQNLLALTKNDNIKTLLMFSSVAGRFGNRGQSDYAAANEVLNKVAQYEQQHRGKSCFVKSYNWGPWESGMVTPALKEAFKARGITVIPQAEGAQLFVDELFEPVGQSVEVIFGDSLESEKKTVRYHVSKKTHPYLIDHQVNDCPVLPVCLVLEWFFRTIVASKEEAIECYDFTVVNGIRLTHFFEEGDVFTIQTEKTSKTQLKCSLIDKDERLCYRGTVSLHNTLQPLASLPKRSGTAWPITLQEAYASEGNSGVLFHGPLFQSISALLDLSEVGGSSSITGLASLKWTEESWRMDVPMVDAMLQTFLLWAEPHLGSLTLPTGFSACRVWMQKKFIANAVCHFTATVKDQFHVECDAILLSENGDTLAEFKGVNMFIYHDSRVTS